MRKATLVLAGLFAAGLAGGVTHADTLQVVVPSDFASSDADLAVHPVGYDHDGVEPGTAPGAPAGFGGSSMYASLGSHQYSTLRVNVAGLFGAPVTVGDLDSLSFDTKGLAAYAIIYTEPSGTGHFYTSRILGDPETTTADWTQWSSDSNLKFKDNTPGAPDTSLKNLSDFSSDAIFGAQKILWIDFKIGDSGHSSTETGQLDAVSFTVNGATHTLDLTAVPLPSAAWGGMALIGLLAACRLGRSRLARG